jgi:hypothetical protein
VATADYRGVTSMQHWRIPRPAESPRTWVSAGLLVGVLVGIAAGATNHGSAPTVFTAGSPARLIAVDIVAPQPVDISFASPVRPSTAKRVATPVTKAAPKPAPAPAAVRPRADRVRTISTVSTVSIAGTDSTCSGDGWQQRRGEQALASLLHAVPAGVSISFLPGRGDLKGMTYYDTHHVDVYVGTCSTESDALLRHVVAHEMGHAWDSEHMTDELRAEYLDARGIPAGTSWFGCNGCRDFATPAGDFAETYAQWQRSSSDSRTQISHPASASELSSLARFFQ